MSTLFNNLINRHSIRDSPFFIASIKIEEERARCANNLDTKGRRTIIRKHVPARIKLRKQFEHLWRKKRKRKRELSFPMVHAKRETFATNCLQGYPRATVLRTCSPLLRRKFCKIAGFGIAGIAANYANDFRTFRYKTLLFVNFQPFPIIFPLLMIKIRKGRHRVNEENLLTRSGIILLGTRKFSRIKQRGISSPSITWRYQRKDGFYI